MTEEFALFIDDSGSPKPNRKDNSPHFAMGGVLVKRSDEIVIYDRVKQFKQRWNIPEETPLHANEIRSKKKNFAWLGKLEETKYHSFMEDLTDLIVKSPIIVHACVISRSGYCDRYLERYGSKTWEMMKSAFSILAERATKYVASENGSLMIFYEEMGKKEDRLIKKYFSELRSSGHPFNPKTADKYSPLSSSVLSQVLKGLEGKTKNRPEIQLADLCLHPVAKGIRTPSDKAFMAMKNHSRLIDCLLRPDQADLKIKYYCFDD